MSNTALFIATLFGVLVMDAVWLGAVMRTWYPKQLGSLMTDSVQWAPAGAFYALFAVGLFFFVVLPGAQGAGYLQLF